MHGLTQAAFAKKLGVSRAFISVIESGKQGLSRNLLKKMCGVFEVSADWLLAIEDRAEALERHRQRILEAPKFDEWPRGFQNFVHDEKLFKDSGGISEEMAEYVMKQQPPAGSERRGQEPSKQFYAMQARKIREERRQLVIWAHDDEELYELVRELKNLPDSVREQAVHHWLALLQTLRKDA